MIKTVIWVDIHEQKVPIDIAELAKMAGLEAEQAEKLGEAALKIAARRVEMQLQSAGMGGELYRKMEEHFEDEIEGFFHDYPRCKDKTQIFVLLNNQFVLGMCPVFRKMVMNIVTGVLDGTLSESDITYDWIVANDKWLKTKTDPAHCIAHDYSNWGKASLLSYHGVECGTVSGMLIMGRFFHALITKAKTLKNK